MEGMDHDEQQDIFVVVVEPHHHVLKHIHYILRRQLARRKRRKLGKNNSPQHNAWQMLHFDAHPDLACPNRGIPAGACFRPGHEWEVETEAG